MLRKTLFFLLATAAVGITGCEFLPDLGDGGDKATEFTVHVENVSQPGTIDSDRAGGAVPLSPGVYAVFQGKNPMFAPGARADNGTERIAEDGFPMRKAGMVNDATNVSASGIFDSAGGPDNGPAIFPGESAMFTIEAHPGDHLQFETMFVQSNDWFYAFEGEGLALFRDHMPISGDVTAHLVLYDAGTEEDTAPGTGPDQKPVQDPRATNVGPPDDDKSIRPASDTGFPIPPTASVIRVTITPKH